MSKTILVADDSKTIQTVVALTFRATQFKVISVGDGDEALRKIPELKPDIVLADVGMPGKNGYELCSQLKSSAHTAGIPVLLLTGVEPLDDRRASESRADGHIKKPFDSQSLIDRVNAVTSAPRPVTDAPSSFGSSTGIRPKLEQKPLAPAPGAPAPASSTRMPPGVAQMPMAAKPAPAPSAAAGGMTMSASAGLSTSGGSGGWTPVAVAAPTPFGAPRSEARAFGSSSAPPPDVVPFARPVSDLPVEVVEPEYADDGSVEAEEVRRVPSLEPPRPPAGMSPAPSISAEPRPRVDVWALAEDGNGRAGDKHAQAARTATTEAYGEDDDAIEEVEIIDVAGSTPPAPRADLKEVVAPIAAKAAAPIAQAAQAAVPGLPHDELVRIARDVIERIAWEVVPELAETIIRAELERLTKDA